MKKRLTALALVLLMLFAAAGAEGAAERAVIYYPDTEGENLTAVTREIASTGNRGYALVKALMTVAGGGKAAPLLNGSGKLVSYEQTGSIITVCFETEDEVSQKDRILCVLAVWKTLSENRNVGLVNVRIDGKPVQYAGETFAGLNRTENNDVLTLDSLLAEALISRSLVTYRSEEGYTVPEAKVWTADVEEILSACGEYDYRAAVTEDGHTIAEVAFSEGTANVSSAAAVTLTLTSNLESIDGVRFYVNGKKVTRFTETDGRELLAEDGVFTRESFLYRLGGVAIAAQENTNGKVNETQLATSASAFSSPAAMAAVCCSDFISGADIRSAAIVGTTAYVDLTGGFYASQQSLTAQQERNNLYRLVNAICLNCLTETVILTAEGLTIETYGGSIPTDGPLYPNYALCEGGITQ